MLLAAAQAVAVAAAAEAAGAEAAVVHRGGVFYCDHRKGQLIVHGDGIYR